MLARGPSMGPCLAFPGPAGRLCAPALPGMGLAASPWSQVRRAGSVLMCGVPRETAEEAALRRGGGRGTKGLYVRPSKALEVGGGFYVPGLEGYRLRVAIVGLVFTLLTLNRLLLPGFEPQFTQVVSEGITGLTAIFVLAQALLDAAFKGGGEAVVESAGDEERSGGTASAPNSSDVYVDVNVGSEQGQRLSWLVSAALQSVQAGSCTLVVGTSCRVAAAGASAPSSEQVQAALVWMSGQAGTAKIVSRSDTDGSEALLGALPGSVSQALVAVADSGDLGVIVGLRVPRVEWRDANEREWLRALANMPCDV